MNMTEERKTALDQLKVLKVQIEELEAEVTTDNHVLRPRLDALRVRRLVLENTFLPGSPPKY